MPRRNAIEMKHFASVRAEWGGRPYQKEYCIVCTGEDHHEDLNRMVSHTKQCKTQNHPKRDSRQRVRYLRLHTPPTSDLPATAPTALAATATLPAAPVGTSHAVGTLAAGAGAPRSPSTAAE